MTVSVATLNVGISSTATYTVVLDARPTAAVTVTPSSNAEAKATVSGALTFAADSWDTAQTVMVTGVAAGSATVSHGVVSTDSDYSGITVSGVSVTVPSRTLVASSITDTTATLTIGNYTGDWYYKYTSPTGGVCSTTALTGTTASLSDLTAETSYTFSAYSDSGCSTLLATAAAFTTLSTPGVTVSVATLNVGISSTATYTVVLDARPTAAVTVTPSSNAEAKATVSGALTFATDSWDTAQTVMVTGVAAGSATVSHGVVSTDSDYSGITVSGVSVTVPSRTLVASSITDTTATLTIGNYTGDWYYKYTSPTGGVCSTTALTGTTASLSDLTAETSYTFSAYSDSGCSTLLATAAAFTTLSTPGVTVSVATLNVGISSTATYTVVLDARPTAAVTVTPSSNAEAKATVSGALTFATDSWDTAQTVMVTGVAAGSATVSHGVVSTDSDYSGITVSGVSVTVPSRTLVASSITDTTATLTIGNYTGDWYYKYTSPTGGVCSTTALTGTTASLSDLTAETSYTFSAYSDSGCSTLLATAAAFTTLSTPGVTVSVATLNVGISSTATYTVVLDARPTAAVTVTPSSNAEAKATVSGALTFATDSWDTAQTVMVTGVAAGSATVSHGVVSTDSDYSGITVSGVSVTVPSRTLVASSITDTTATLTIGNYTGDWYYKYTSPTGGVCSTTALTGTTASLSDLTAETSYTFSAYSDSGCSTLLATAAAFTTLSTPGVTVSVATLNVGISSTATYTVVLDARPTAAVTVTPSSNAEAKATVSGALTFATDSWDTAQTVMVTGVAAGSATVSHGVVSTDSDYSGITVSGVSVTVPSRTLVASSITDTTATLTIGNYTGDWYYKYTSPTGGVCSTTALTGTTASLSDLTAETSYTFSAYSDSGCSTLLATAAAFTTLSTPGVTVSVATLNVGISSTATYTVVLDARPTAAVTVTPSSNAEAKATVSGALTFATDSWDTAQTVMVTGVAAGSATVSHGVVSTDSDYSGITVSGVSVTVPSRTLVASSITDTTATLTIGNYTGDWYYKYTSPTGGVCSTTALTGTTASLSDLTAETSYTFSAYSDSGCSTLLATAAAFTTLSTPGVTVSVATLNVGISSTATYTVVLDARPTAAVTVTPSSNAEAKATVSGALTFATDSWDTAQTVMVTGVAAGSATVSHGVVSTDSDYSGITVSGVSVTVPSRTLVASSITDTTATLTIGNYTGDWYYKYTSPTGGVCSTTALTGTTASLSDLTAETSYTFSAYSDSGCSTLLATAAAFTTLSTPGVTVSVATLNVGISSTATYTVVLDARPTAAVTVTPSSNAEAKATVSGALTFATDSWDTAQTVMVTGVAAGSATVSHGVVSTDSDYSGITVSGVSVTVPSRTLVASSITDTTATLTIGNYTGDWYYKYTSPTGGVCSTTALTGTTASLSDLTAETSYTFSAYSDSGCSTLLATAAAFTTLSTPGVTVSVATLNVGISSTATYTVVLDARPTAAVTVTPSSNAEAKATVSGALTFATDSWDTAQTVMVTGVAAGSATVSHGVVSTDSDYSGITVSGVSVTVPSRTLVASSITDTTATLTIGNYTGDWYYKYTSPTGGVCSTTALTGTTASLSDLTAETSYTFSAYSDSGCSTLLATAAAFTTLSTPGVTVSVATLNVGISSTATYTVVLDARPTAAVTVTPSSNAEAKATVSGALTFATDSWDTAQTVMVTGVAAGSATVSHGVVSTDSDYSGITVSGVSVTVPSRTLVASSITDTTATLTIGNYTGDWYYKYTSPTGGVCSTTALTGTTASLSDLTAETSYTFSAYSDSGCSTLLATAAAFTTLSTPGVTVSVATLNVGISSTATYTVVLDARPTAAVTVTPSSNAEAKATVSGALTFATDSWDTAQTVMVTGVAAGSATVSHGVVSTDSDYSGITVSGVSVTVPSRTLVASSITDTTATLTIGNYTGDWYYKYTSPTGGVCSTTALTGTTASLSDLTAETSYTFSAYSDSGCSTLLATAAAFTTLSTPGVTVSVATLNVGISSTATYTVVLDARPTAAVTVTPSSNAEAKATVSGALTFATDSWDTAQTVMVTGVAAGSATVSHGVVSTDSDYSGITVSGVSVTVPSRTLVASSITDTTATLTIGNYTGDWYYKYTSPTGGVCSTTALTGTTASLSDLTAETSYTFSAYSDSGCSTLLATAAAFTTLSTPGVTVSVATLNVGISSTATYTVVLDARPTAAVTVTPSSNAEAKATVSGALTFATDSWDTAQTVMVTGVAAGSATVSHGVVSTDSDYSGITVSGVSVTVPSRTLVASSITDTTATLTIGNYTGDWYYKYTSPTGGVCSTTALTGTTASLSDLTAETSYTFSAYSDSGCSTLLATAAAFTTLSTPGVTVSVATLNVGISSTATYTVVLDARPTAAVTVTPSSNAEAKATVSGALTFATDSWDTAQTVMVTGVAAGSATVSHGVVSTDSDYSGITVSGVSVTVPSRTLVASSITDTTATLTIGNYTGDWYYKYTSPTGGVCSTTALTGTTASLSDLTAETSYTFSAYSDSGCSTLLATAAAFTTLSTPGVTVSVATLNVGISSTATYTVVLDARPTAAVTVTPSSNAEAKATVSGALTFATDSWDTAQTVMVTGVAAGSATVSHGVVSTDSDYSGITVSGVSVTVPSRTLVASSITDTTATLTIGNYTGDWYYKYTSPTGGVCSTTALTGTTASLSDLTAETSYTFSAYSDSGCSTLLATAAAFTTLSTPGVTVSVATLNVGISSTATYTVVLDARPTAAVTVTPSSNAEAKATVSGALTFAADSWDTAQTVMVTGVAAGSATVSHGVVSTDSDYSGITVSGVSVPIGAVVARSCP